MTKLAKSVFRAVSVLSVLLALTCQAKADIITTFDVTGTFVDGSSMTGNVKIDTTTGAATAMDITLGAPDSFVFSSANPSYELATFPNYGPSAINQVQSVILLSPSITITDNTLGDYLWPDISLLTETSSLVGYSGGPLWGVAPYSAPTPNFGSTQAQFTSHGDNHYLYSGDLVAVSSISTPEPGFLTLLASGFLTAGAFGLYRRPRGKASEATPAC